MELNVEFLRGSCHIGRNAEHWVSPPCNGFQKVLRAVVDPDASFSLFFWTVWASYCIAPIPVAKPNARERRVLNRKEQRRYQPKRPNAIVSPPNHGRFHGRYGPSICPYVGIKINHQTTRTTTVEMGNTFIDCHAIFFCICVIRGCFFWTFARSFLSLLRLASLNSEVHSLTSRLQALS